MGRSVTSVESVDFVEVAGMGCVLLGLGRRSLVG